MEDILQAPTEVCLAKHKHMYSCCWTGPPGRKWRLPRHSWVTLCWLNWGVLMLTVSLICSHSYWVWAMVWNVTAFPGAESPLLKDWDYRSKEGFLQPYLPEPANTKSCINIKPHHTDFTDTDIFSKQIHATLSVFPKSWLSCVIVTVSSTMCKY